MRTLKILWLIIGYCPALLVAGAIVYGVLRENTTAGLVVSFLLGAWFHHDVENDLRKLKEERKGKE
jgi:hypothetical protein